MSVSSITVRDLADFLSKAAEVLSQNRAEPWMAEPSVQGSIHSVF